MKVPLADLRAQYFELKTEIDQAIVEVIESTRFSGGTMVEQLEREIATSCGARHGIGVASGTDALTLSLVACGVERGDEVITTPFTFGATSEAIAQIGARPVYVDIDPCTFNIAASPIEARITSRTRAILPVDLFGQMADRQLLRELAQKHNLRLIVDSAQAIGASQNGTLIAEDGDTTTLSFYPTKNLGAYGDGGMILCNDDHIAERLRSLRGHGTQGHKYHYVQIGYCSRLDAIQAAVLQAKLPRLSEWNAGRRRNAARYTELLGPAASESGGKLALPTSEPSNYHVFHQYTVRHLHRDALKAFLKTRDIETDVYYPAALHLQPAYAYLGYREGEFPHAERAAREVLSLPIHPELAEEQLVYVAEQIASFGRP